MAAPVSTKTVAPVSNRWYPQHPEGQPVNPQQLNNHLRILTDGQQDNLTAFQSIMQQVNVRVAVEDFIKQGSPISQRTLYTVPTNKSGLYRLDYYFVTDQPGSSGTGKFNAFWTDPTGQGETFTSSNINFGSLSYTSGGVLMYAVANSDIGYSVTFAGTAGGPIFNLYVRLMFEG